MDNEEKIKKCLKSYLTGKKYSESDKSKAFEFFKQSLKYLNLIDKDFIINKKDYADVLQETETECNKFITLTIENTIERNIPINNDIKLFEIIEKGDIQQLKNIKSNHLNFNIYDEEGNTPIHKAIKYGDTTFLKACFKLGSPIDIVNKNGHSALEYACLERDPNMIKFLLNNGGDMKKHLFFRDGEKKNLNKQTYIDIAIILKLILTYHETEINSLSFLFNYFKKEDYIEFDNYTYNDLFKCMETLLDKIPNISKENYINIIRDELVFPLKSSLECPNNKLELLLVYLVPFIDFPFNLSIDWYLNLELKYFFIKLLKEHKKINIEEKNIIMNYIWENYIKNNLLQEEYLGNLISQWVSKIKV